MELLEIDSRMLVEQFDELIELNFDFLQSELEEGFDPEGDDNEENR